MPPASKARLRANAKYNKKTYDRIDFRVPKGHKELIRAYATENGESLNAFINRAINEIMKPNEL